MSWCLAPSTGSNPRDAGSKIWFCICSFHKCRQVLACIFFSWCFWLFIWECLSVWVCQRPGPHKEAREQLKGGGSLLLPRLDQGSNSSCVALGGKLLYPLCSLHPWSVHSKNTSRLLPGLVLSGLRGNLGIHSNLPMCASLSQLSQPCHLCHTEFTGSPSHLLTKLKTALTYTKQALSPKRIPIPLSGEGRKGY